MTVCVHALGTHTVIRYELRALCPARALGSLLGLLAAMEWRTVTHLATTVVGHLPIGRQGGPIGLAFFQATRLASRR